MRWTGAGNRRAFMLKGENLLADCSRRHAAALLLCDLDHFKRLNDSFGHPMGDQALIAFTQVTRASAAEMCLRVSAVKSSPACWPTAMRPGRLKWPSASAAGLPNWTCWTPFLSVSIGIVTTTAAGHDLSYLLSQADRVPGQGLWTHRVQVVALA